MKVVDLLKRAVVVATDAAARPTSARDARREAVARHAAWHQDWAEAQRAFRATHPPGVRVPGPRQLGMSWPPPSNPNAGIQLGVHTENDDL